MSLLKKGLKLLSWYVTVNEAFKNLKITFTTALILKHPDPLKPFVMEVDASESGVGAVLSKKVWGQT